MDKAAASTIPGDKIQSDSLVSDWLGVRFQALHPLLQRLHLQGGVLRGQVTVAIPQGVGGWIGARLARKLGVPSVAGEYPFTVSISSDKNGLHWNRCFGEDQRMYSLFRPVGCWPAGHWLENTGALHMQLTVDVIDGGWYWRPLRMTFMRVRIPLALVPRSAAYKRIEEGQYRFYVGFALPLLGTVLSYGGLLSTD